MSSTDSASRTRTCSQGSRGARSGVPRARRLRRRVPSGGRAEGRPRVDGLGRPARDDAGRPGPGDRRGRRKRAGRRRRRPGGDRTGGCAHSRRSCARRLARRDRARHRRALRVRAARPRLGRAPSTAGSRAMADLERAGRYARAGARWGRLLVSGRPAPGVRVFYGHDRVPAPGEPVAGGTAKFQRLATRFPNHPTDFSLLYLGSTWLPRDLRPLLWHARRRRVPLVLNQNGIGYPGWAGAGHRRVQRAAAPRPRPGRARPLPERVLQAVGRRVGGGAGRVVGDPHERGRRPALHAGRAARRRTGRSSCSAATSTRPTGSSSACGRSPRSVPSTRTRSSSSPAGWSAGRASSSTGSVSAVASRCSGGTHRRTRPAIFRRAHVLLHTKVNDPCPSVVIEAMASGLPVVYARSGGVPELVGDDAGIGVPHPDGFERDEPPRAGRAGRGDLPRPG